MSVVSHARGREFREFKEYRECRAKTNKAKMPKGSTDHRKQWSKEAKIPIRLNKPSGGMG